MTYTVIIESDEARSGVTGKPIVTNRGDKFWPTIDIGGWVEASSTRCSDKGERPPNDVLTFSTKEKAEAFGKRWKGHPWWVKPIGYEVIELTPKFKQVKDGYLRV